MAVPEKAAKMATAAARQRLSPAITQQAKAICSGRAFGSSDVSAVCGGVQGECTPGGAAAFSNFFALER